MDPRRINDTLKLVGALVGAVSGTIVALVPFLSGRPLAIASAIIAALGSLGGAFAAGLGTRAVGTEYQDVADAKAIAKVSLMPPPMPSVIIAPSLPSRPPAPPTEAM
jgi:hypothetical protein